MEQLYAQYKESIVIQTDVIKKNRQKLNAAISDKNVGEIKRLNTLLKVLYEEKWELEEKSRQIKRYLGT